jgi:putative hydrolase of the HAD superfamily
VSAAPLRAVLFDYGDTLATHTRPVEALHRAYTRIAASLPRRADERPWNADELLVVIHDLVEGRLAANNVAGGLEEVDIEAIHRGAYAELGLALDPQQIDEAMRLEQEAWWEGVHLGPGVVETLAVLRRAGMRVGICSNAAYRPASMRAQLDYIGLLPLVDSAVFSSEVGWRKPAPQIFAAALDALNAEPATTVMVGDTVVADIDGAHAAGMRAIRLREHRDDPDPEQHADAVLDRLTDLPALLAGRFSMRSL